jgi:hypothetical protein
MTMAVLLSDLAVAVSLLRSLGDTQWADRLASARELIAGGSAPAGLTLITGCFGGVGSINDSYPADAGTLGSVLARLYATAAQLRADLDYPR